MTTLVEEIKVCSEYGDLSYNNSVTIKLDGSQPECPITLFDGETALFSFGNEELDEFIKALKSFELE